MDPAAPIGVFDSGIGGLSVLRALLQQLPSERFIYVADTGHAPYGEQAFTAIGERSRRIARFLRERCRSKALVIACNTATAIAALQLRELHAGWPIIGIEPAIKPAAAATRTGQVGVLATQATLSSERYRRLRERVLRERPHTVDGAHPIEFHEVACLGLASAIDAMTANSPAMTPVIHVDALLRRYLARLGLQPDARSCAVDTVVLGCTHYPLVADQIEALLPAGVALIDPAHRVAAHTRHVLEALGNLKPRDGAPTPPDVAPSRIDFWTSGEPAQVLQAARRWLQCPVDQVHALPV